MNRTALAVIVITGIFASPVAFAGQLNALGQWAPTSSAEGRKGWSAAGPTEATAGSAAVAQSPVGAAVEAVRSGRSERELRYRIDALGREVPIQTNLP